MGKKVKDIMTKDPVCCCPDSRLEEIARLMSDYDCGEIPVLDSTDKPVGVVTDRDIVTRGLAKGKDAYAKTARDCMTSPCITVTPETTLEECCRVMEEHQIRRVPVVDEEGRCCGIVAQADIALNAPREQVAEVLQEISRGE